MNLKVAQAKHALSLLPDDAEICVCTTKSGRNVMKKPIGGMFLSVVDSEDDGEFTLAGPADIALGSDVKTTYCLMLDS